MAMRHALAALLMAVLALAGVGRGFAVESQAGEIAFQSILGVAMPICHSGGEASSPVDPGAPAHHTCCDECTLGAPAILAAAGQVPAIEPISHGVGQPPVLAPTVQLPRARTPRQSQGPPAA